MARHQMSEDAAPRWIGERTKSSGQLIRRTTLGVFRNHLYLTKRLNTTAPDWCQHFCDELLKSCQNAPPFGTGRDKPGCLRRIPRYGQLDLEKKKANRSLRAVGLSLLLLPTEATIVLKETGGAALCVLWQKPETHWRPNEPRLNLGGAKGDAPDPRRRSLHAGPYRLRGAGCQQRAERRLPKPSGACTNS